MNGKEKNSRLIALIGCCAGWWMISNFVAVRAKMITENYGVSFGINISSWLIIFGILGLAYYVIIKFNWGVLLMVAGGVANLVDRLIYGYVRDYWSLPFVHLVNNINDWLITLGVVIFFWRLWKQKR